MRIAPACHRAALLLSLTLPLVAIADAAAPSREASTTSSARWWPAVAIEGGAFAHRFDNDIVSSPVLGPPIEPPGANAPTDTPQPIRPPASESSDYVAPYVEGSLELVGPAFESIGGLRLFAHGSLGAEFGLTKDLPKEGVTGPFEIPDPGNFPPINPETDELESLVRGQGSRLEIETENLFFTAGVGAALTFGMGERTWRVKPSFEYLWEEVKAEGVVNRAVLLEDPQVTRPTGLESYRLISLNAEHTEDFHAIGPGLEIETDLSRRDRLVASVFLSGRAYFFMGSRDFDMIARNAEGETATFHVDRDPVSYRAGVGIRLRFEP
jgi:hypothetical protein